MKNSWWQTVVGVIFFGYLFSFCSNPKKQIHNQPIEEIVFLEESCKKVESLFGSSSKLSTVQQEEAWINYKGKGFKWKLKVHEVQNTILKDGYLVSFLCQGSSALIVDVTITYPLSSKEFVLSLVKGKSYEVSGVLGDYSSIVGLSADAILN